MRRIKLTLTLYDSLSSKDIGTNYLIKNAGKLYKGENLYWSNIEEYVPSLPVGGKIFYIHSDNGATYKFWDASDNELTTQTVEGLQNAVKYAIVSGTPTADKFYVLNTSVGTNGLASGTWGGYGTEQGTKNYNYIGGGRLATNTAKANLENTSGCIWYWLKNTVNVVGNSTGCTDWFIGSGPNTYQGDDTNTELGKLRNAISTYPTIFANQSTWFSSQYIWCSVEYLNNPSNLAVYWNYGSRYWDGYGKYYAYAVFAVRAF